MYSFGMQGLPLSQYLHVSRYVERHFRSDVLVFNVVHNDFDESLRAFLLSPTYLQLQQENSAFVETVVVPYSSPRRNQWIRKSALVRYLWLNANIGHLTDVARRGGNVNANIEVDRVAENREAIESAVRFLLARVQQEYPHTPVMYMMDAPRFDLCAGRLKTSNVLWLNELMRRTCEEVGCHFLDLSGPFAERFGRDSLRFESPYDAH